MREAGPFRLTAFLKNRNKLRIRHKIAAMNQIIVKKVEILTSLKVFPMEGYLLMNKFLLLTLYKKWKIRDCFSFLTLVDLQDL